LLLLLELLLWLLELLLWLLELLLLELLPGLLELLLLPLVLLKESGLDFLLLLSRLPEQLLLLLGLLEPLLLLLGLLESLLLLGWLESLAGRLGRLTELLLEELCVGWISRIDEVAHILATGACWHIFQELRSTERLLRLPLLLLLLELLGLLLLLELLRLLLELLGLEGLPSRLLWLELSSVGVELEIPVCRVGRVYEGVHSLLLLLLGLLEPLVLLPELEAVCGELLLAPGGLPWCCWPPSCRPGPGGLLLPACWPPGPPHGPGPGRRLLLHMGDQALPGDLGVIGGRGEAGGSGGHVVSLNNTEAVLAGCVLHRDGLALRVNVAVLANTLAISRGLLPGDGAVLLGVSRSKPAIPSVEPLLLQYLGVLAPELLG